MQTDDTSFNGAFREQSIHGDRSGLTDTMHTIHRLMAGRCKGRGHSSVRRSLPGRVKWVKERESNLPEDPQKDSSRARRRSPDKYNDDDDDNDDGLGSGNGNDRSIDETDSINVYGRGGWLGCYCSRGKVW